MSKSTGNRRSRKADRPKKPYPDFPLTPHASGAWQKKILGKTHYFGRWACTRNGKLERIEGDGWKEALELYKAQADDLHAGRTPRVKKTGEGLTLAELSNRFLNAKLAKLKAGELTRRTFDEYRGTTDLLIAQFGKARLVADLASDDFEALRNTMAERWGPVRLGNAIQRIRTVGKYWHEAGLIDKPVRYGPEFKKPSASVLRRHKAKNGEQMLEAHECRRLLDAAPVQLRAMILLGLNCGFGNHDVATLPTSALDLGKCVVDFPRPKTGIERRCPLWSETVEALRAVLAQRSEPRQNDAEGLAFVTSRGKPWLSGGIANPVSKAVRELMKTTGVHRPGLGFYTLRHVHRTVADGARDPVAANLVMGHADGSMAATYRERIDDARLVAVVEHVRAWLFPESPEEKRGD